MPSDAIGPSLVVSTEEEAVALLEYILAGKLSDQHARLIIFDGWPNLNIYLPRTPVSGSISPTMMGAFIELQTSIYRAYSLLSSDTADLRGLSRIEKDELEFRVEVNNGSSDYSANLTQAVTTIGTSIASKMTPNDTFIAVLVLSVLVASVFSFQTWLKHRAEMRRTETHNEETKLYLEAQRDLLSHDERLAGLLANAMQRQPVLEDIDAVIEPARQSVIQAVGEERGGRVQGIEVSSRLANEVTSQSRQQSVIVSLHGVYRVSKVDTTSPDGFRVTFSNITTGEEISASLQDAFISEDHRATIREAEWSKLPVQVWFRVKKLRNRNVDAVVIDVKNVDIAPRVATE